ncbi:PP2C family protein-serine/threonine phosphatase [Couchioplanes caeruleus]|uniref:Protein phosphatase n=2 Tax=Couchioplanes caeruleus TaxID=56438 RepID=A0A1K0FGU4_9ACTN|nr:PP2C family protein-serine/threonine phosphatase [Couchioplanes caeruleus]OJF12057.1 protein phosphatase [Couchioplanes caeruleus subsp. caeruleus]ROP29749.1 stage II sporulation protein E [Couchioplanes caeruleus]
MSERLTAVRRALADAPADRVVECLAEVVAKEYAAGDLDLLLVDYRLAALLPLFAGPPVTRPGDPAWRSFDHQAEVTAGQVAYLPVTTRGERLGVLRRSPAPSSEVERAELAEIATLLAHELQAAGAGTDRYTVAARTRRLTLAAEMQWELLPGRCRVGREFSLAGQLEPAYAVRGDGFDWSEYEGRVFLTVLNGMGEGVSAALLTSLAVHALRNARRAGLCLADQAALADQAIFAQHRGEAHVEALLLELDPLSGELTMVDTGSPRLMVLRAGEVLDHPLGAQFPLGMFETSDYVTRTLRLSPGDRLIVVSDGISDAAGHTGRYGDAALHRFVRRTAALAPLQAVRSLLGDLRAFVSGDLEDDAVAVCLDWTGPRH